MSICHKPPAVEKNFEKHIMYPFTEFCDFKNLMSVWVWLNLAQPIITWRDLWSLNLPTSCMVEESSLVCGKSAKFYTTSDMTAHSGSNSVSVQINFEYFSIRRRWSIKLHSPFANWQVGKNKVYCLLWRPKQVLLLWSTLEAKGFVWMVLPLILGFHFKGASGEAV